MVAVSLPAAGRDGSPAAWLSSLWLIARVTLVLLTGPEWVWDKLGTAEFLEQHGQIQEKMLPVVQNCDFGG